MTTPELEPVQSSKQVRDFLDALTRDARRKLRLDPEHVAAVVAALDSGRHTPTTLATLVSKDVHHYTYGDCGNDLMRWRLRQAAQPSRDHTYTGE